MLASSGQTAPLHFDHCRLTGTAPCRNSAEAAFLPHAVPADSPVGQVRDRPRLWQPLCFPGLGALLPGTRLFLTLSVLLSPPGSPLVLSCSADGLAPCFTEGGLCQRPTPTDPRLLSSPPSRSGPSVLLPTADPAVAGLWMLSPGAFSFLSQGVSLSLSVEFFPSFFLS